MKPAPQSIPFAVSASPRYVGRSVGGTPRFGRECWPQGQPHSTPYSENVRKTAATEINIAAPPFLPSAVAAGPGQRLRTLETLDVSCHGRENRRQNAAASCSA